MKKIILLLTIAIGLVYSCSVDRLDTSENGYNSLINSEVVNISPEHPHGGVYWYSGLDINRDFILQTEEITNVTFISNGGNGTDGLNGADGTDGNTSIIEQLINTPSDGYTTINVGIDLNSNGVLDYDEITSTTTIQNGADGIDGIDGKTTFITVEIITDSNICEYGGVSITTGFVGEEDDADTVNVCCTCTCEDEPSGEKILVCVPNEDGNETWIIPESEFEEWSNNYGATIGECVN